MSLQMFVIILSPVNFVFQQIRHGFPESTPSEGATSPIFSHKPRSAESPDVKESVIYKLETVNNLERKRTQDDDQTVRTLEEFLEKEESNMKDFLLPPKTLLRYALLMDIVHPQCRRSVCFTKG